MLVNPTDLLALLLAAFPLMGSPGPATLSTAAVGAAFGAARGKGYLCGIIAGTTGVLVLIATGVTGVVLALPAAVWVISVLAAAYILYLAYRIATAPVMAASSENRTVPTMANGFVLAIANPKAFAAIGAVFSSHSLIEADPLLDAVAKIIVLCGVIIIVNTAWLLFGAVISSMLSDPRMGRIANIVFALLLVASVAAAFLPS